MNPSNFTSMTQLATAIYGSRAKTPDSMFRHVMYRLQKHKYAPDRTHPLLMVFNGAGIIFSRGHRMIRVRNDCCEPYVFDGEEFTLGMRMWTHGYDIYMPSEHFTFHPYFRRKQPMFWTERDNHITD